MDIEGDMQAANTADTGLAIYSEKPMNPNVALGSSSLRYSIPTSIQTPDQWHSVPQI